ncbi:unnamed protein product, partial [Musa hybrid cultivar]
LCIDNANQRFVTNFNPNDLAFPRCNGSIQLSIEHRVLLVFANLHPRRSLKGVFLLFAQRIGKGGA